MNNRRPILLFVVLALAATALLSIAQAQQSQTDAERNARQTAAA